MKVAQDDGTIIQSNKDYNNSVKNMLRQNLILETRYFSRCNKGILHACQAINASEILDNGIETKHYINDGLN